MQGSYRLKGATLEEIRAKALAKYGPGARIVSADLVTSQGVAGLFAGSRYEAVVQIAASEPAPGAPAGVVAPAAGVVPAAEAVPANAAEALPGPVQAPHRLHRSAIAGLLAAADATDATEVKTTAPVAVSTGSPDFAKVLEQFTALAPAVATTVTTTAPGAGPAPAAAAVQVAATVPRSSGPGGRRARQGGTAPALLTGAGDLIILLGLGTDALDVALAMSLDRGGADVRTAGQLTAFGHLHVAGRLDATAARAQAVENGQIVILAFGLGKRPDIPRAAPAVNALRGDQAWAVVDAGRKSADSLAWLEPLGAAVDLAAVVAVGLAGTGSPETVLDLGWPVSHPHGLD